MAIIINILLRTRGIYPSEKLKAGVHLTDFYFAEWGMGADGFWLYNVYLMGIGNLNGFNLQYILQSIYILHSLMILLGLVTREIDEAHQLEHWGPWIAAIFTV